MGTYLIDSNVLIDYAGQQFKGIPEEMLDEIFNNTFFYSVISRMEVLGFNAPSEVLDGLENFLNFGETVYITDEITTQTILIRRLLPKIKLPDVIIAASALVHNYTLLTRNTSDFKSIPGLHVENPWDWEIDEKAF